MQTIYIAPDGNKFGILPSQAHLIKEDWVECQRKEDGTYADNYNLDGSIDSSGDAVKAQLQSAFDTLNAEFEKLPKGRQSFWKNIREDVGQAVLSGDFAEAREILETAPAVDAKAETERTTFLNLLPPA